MSMQPPRPAPMLPERRYGGLRTLAGACIFSAWITLVLSVITGLVMLAAPSPGMMPTLPSPGGMGNDLGLPGGGGLGQAGSLLTLVLPGLKAIGAVTTIGGGVLSFFFLAACGHGLQLLLDMEENTRITAQALAQIARRQ